MLFCKKGMLATNSSIVLWVSSKLYASPNEKLNEYVPITPLGSIVFGLKTISPDASSPVTEAPIPFQKLA